MPAEPIEIEALAQELAAALGDRLPRGYDLRPGRVADGVPLDDEDAADGLLHDRFAALPPEGRLAVADRLVECWATPRSKVATLLLTSGDLDDLAAFCDRFGGDRGYLLDVVDATSESRERGECPDPRALIVGLRDPGYELHRKAWCEEVYAIVFGLYPDAAEAVWGAYLEDADSTIVFGALFDALERGDPTDGGFFLARLYAKARALAAAGHFGRPDEARRSPWLARLTTEGSAVATWIALDAIAERDPEGAFAEALFLGDDPVDVAVARAAPDLGDERLEGVAWALRLMSERDWVRRHCPLDEAPLKLRGRP